MNAKKLQTTEAASIYEGQSDQAKVVGTIGAGQIAWEIETCGTDWTYIESGQVRGFIHKSVLKDYVDGDGYAETSVPVEENAAYAYCRGTEYDVVIPKDYLIANTDASIYEKQDAKSEEAGKIAKGGLAFLIQECGDWYYIESGDVRGFIPKSAVDDVESITGDETSYQTATKSEEPKDNAALYFSMQSIKSGKTKGEDIVQYARQFVGNPYVWGGTDPVNGADCSGFVQTIYRQFGISLPRTADEQARVGTRIPVSSAQPGDLIFYGTEDHIYHVAIAAGNGETVEALGSKFGIVNYHVRSSAAWAVHLSALDDADNSSTETAWSGSVLNRTAGTVEGPSGKETYYNLDMKGVVAIMRSMGNNDPYWVRSDGVKMLGQYVMVAADLNVRPRGSLVQTSQGIGIVCDTGTFALTNHTQLDIAVNW